MRKVFSGFLIACITFMVGLSTYRLVQRLSSGPNFAYDVFIAPASIFPRFSPTGRGCGNGYVQGYATNHGERLAEGVQGFRSRKEARNAFNDEKNSAVRIIERTVNYRDHKGNVGERIIAVFPSKVWQDTTVSILFYDGSDFMRHIDAPSLDLALEFEQYLIDTDLSRSEKYRILR